jgi:hypothetical protein
MQRCNFAFLPFASATILAACKQGLSNETLILLE